MLWLVLLAACYVAGAWLFRGVVRDSCLAVVVLLGGEIDEHAKFIDRYSLVAALLWPVTLPFHRVYWS